MNDKIPMPFMMFNVSKVHAENLDMIKVYNPFESDSDK